MKNYFTSDNQIKNIQTAELLLIDLGFKSEYFYKSGYSESNGISVYFKLKTHFNSVGSEMIMRVSDHSISNKGRMEDTLCFYFDIISTRFSSSKSKFESNKQLKKIYGV